MKYTVFLTQEKQGNFHAIVPMLPDCQASAPTRQEALKMIHQTITQVINHSEIIQLEVSAQPKPVLEETPWQWFGAFSDDPTWGELFDEIERQRYGAME